MVALSRCLISVLMLAGAEGSRVRQSLAKETRKRRRHDANTKVIAGIDAPDPPQIAGLFPFGSPGSARPPLENWRGGPCFPGARFWTRTWTAADFATTATGLIGYRHPYLAGVAIDVRGGRAKNWPCDGKGSNLPSLPRGIPRDLHAKEGYISGSEQMSDLIYNMSNIGVRESFTEDADQAASNAARYGWNLAGSAVDDGGAVYVGRQVSHLFQEPQTKACILTFQGSSSPQDWASNFDITQDSFCGLGVKGERLAPGESLVHRGFRDALRMIVQNQDWQDNVRSKLSTCAKVYVTGHSLGGAQAELFAACVQRAPQPGEAGYEEDYKFIGW